MSHPFNRFQTFPRLLCATSPTNFFFFGNYFLWTLCAAEYSSIDINVHALGMFEDIKLFHIDRLLVPKSHISYSFPVLRVIHDPLKANVDSSCHICILRMTGPFVAPPITLMCCASFSIPSILQVPFVGCSISSCGWFSLFSMSRYLHACQAPDSVAQFDGLLQYHQIFSVFLRNDFSTL